MRSFIFLVGIIFLVGVGGCQTFELNQQFDVGNHFYHDLDMEVNKKEYNGIAVIPYSDQVMINAKVKHKFDYYSVRTFHQEIFKEDSTKKLEEKVILNPEIDNGLVIIDIGLFNLKKTQHYWGKIVVVDKDQETKLGSLLICNGKKAEWVGTSGCQARENSLQYIGFKSAVKYVENEGCEDTLFAKTPSSFEIKIKSGICIYRFAEESGNQHRLITYGYNKIFFRELLE